jgi:hypothetical protein
LASSVVGLFVAQDEHAPVDSLQIGFAALIAAQVPSSVA